MPVPLPPIEEQWRIAAILDAADALRTKRRQAIAKLDTLTQAIFIDMFGNPTQDGALWPTVRLGDFVPTTSGGTPRRSRSEFFAGDIPWVKSGELHGGRIVDTEERITAEALESSSAKLMPIGTVLLAMYGATIGAVATLGVDAATNQAICSLAPTDEVLGPYLVGFLHVVKEDLVRRGAGGAQPNISQTIIRDLGLILPPKVLQKEYSDRLAEAHTLESLYEEATIADNNLFASLQQRAFRGEL